MLFPTIAILQKGPGAVQGGPKALPKVLSGTFLAGPYFKAARDKAVHEYYGIMVGSAFAGKLKSGSFLFLRQIV